MSDPTPALTDAIDNVTEFVRTFDRAATAADALPILLRIVFPSYAADAVAAALAPVERLADEWHYGAAVRGTPTLADLRAALAEGNGGES